MLFTPYVFYQDVIAHGSTARKLNVIIDILEPKYQKAEIEAFQNENEFMDAYVELLKQTIEILYKLVESGFYRSNEKPKTIDRDQAIVAGNLSRLIKLNVSFLQNLCEGKLEICLILSRCLAETAINLKFILVNGEDRVKRNYVKNSLITEKELWETIKENIESRSGDIHHIEDRMQKSILKSFEKSDFDLEEVRRSSKWGSIKQRAKDVANEQFYNVFYGISSHSIHGNWQEILMNNLHKVEGGFEVDIEWNSPRPQIIDAPIILNLEIAQCFNESSDEIDESITKNCKRLTDYLFYLSKSHEKAIEKGL